MRVWPGDTKIWASRMTQREPSTAHAFSITIGPERVTDIGDEMEGKHDRDEGSALFLYARSGGRPLCHREMNKLRSEGEGRGSLRMS